MTIANREIQDVTAVMEVNLVTPTMAIFHPHHLYPKTTTAAINLLVAHLDLRVAAMIEMVTAEEAEVPHHPRQHYLLLHNHLKALLLHLNKAIPLAMEVVAEIAASKVTTTIVARVVGMEDREEGMMGMEVDIDEMMEDEVVVEEGKVDMVDSKEARYRDKEDVRKGKEEVRVSLVDMRVRGEDSRFVPLCRLSSAGFVCPQVRRKKITSIENATHICFVLSYTQSVRNPPNVEKNAKKE